MRKTRLVDCNPKWVENYFGAGRVDAIVFDCPEGHVGCKHVIPFTPALDGTVHAMEAGRGWQRSGDTFETLTLSPSIKRNPRHASREAAIAAGCIPEYVDDSLLCALHIFIQNGQIQFCGGLAMMLRAFAVVFLAPLSAASLIAYLLLWSLGRKGR